MVEDNATLFSGRKAYGYLKHLAVDIGPRPTGGAGERKAARYIAKTFRSFGLDARLQRHILPAYDNKKCVLEVKDGRAWRRLKCEPVMMTPSTPARGIEADVFFLEHTAPEFFTPELEGKIVLTPGAISPEDRPAFLAQKPRALITIEGGLGNELTIGFLTRREYGALPMARILHLDGLDIVRRGLTRARFTMTNSFARKPSYNVIGEKKGDTFPDEIVVVCGHYDSHMGTQGAADNAGGTAVMMELARIFAKEPTRRTLRFIAFSGEESGLHGSRFYANDLYRKDQRERKKKSFREKVDKTELDKHRFTFNCDIHGAVLGGQGLTFNGVDDIGASVRLLAQETATPCGVSKAPMSSDGTSLAAVGVPNVQFARGGAAARCHTVNDDITNLSAEGLARGGAFAEVYVRRHITRAAVFPFPREIPEDQKPGIRDYFKSRDMEMPGPKDDGAKK